MAEFSTAIGSGLSVDLTIGNDGNGETSLICITDSESGTSVALNNLEALNLALELITLSRINNDGGGMSTSEALELHFLSKEP